MTGTQVMWIATLICVELSDKLSSLCFDGSNGIMMVRSILSTSVQVWKDIERVAHKEELLLKVESHCKLVVQRRKGVS